MKWLKGGALALVVLLLAAFVYLATWEPFSALTAEAPEYREYSAEIVRDEYGVPMIYGETDADVAYGVAIAHSEDDFFTLQDVIAMSRGRYGAIAGQDGAQFDFAYHLVDARGTAEREYPGLPADTRALLEAYAVGLNQYAEENPGEVKLGNLFPVNGVDIAAGFALRQPFFYGLGNVIGPLVSGDELRREFGPDIPGFPREGHSPESSAPVDEAEPGGQGRHGLVLPWGEEADHLGSNAWAVTPERSGGPTTLISNSHQPLRGGVAWYELGVQSGEGWHFTGANFPGSPYPFLGHNENLGWTNTVNRPDMADIYKLEVSEDGSQYMLDGEWRELEEISFTLPVKMGPITLPVSRTIYRSAHGPVIRNDNGYFAIRYGGMGSIDQLDAYYRINKASNLEEWETQIARMAIPSTNFIYADREGNIAYVYNAAIPNRPEDVKANWRGILDGTRSDLIWNGPVEYERIPKLINPPSGWIYNANNEPYTAAGEGSDLSPDDFSPVLGIELKQTNRSRRAYQLLSETEGPLTRAELERIKYDTAYVRESYVDKMFDELEALEAEGDLEEARQLLLTWDFTADNVGAADALALLMIRDYMSAEYNNGNSPSIEEHLRNEVDHLMEHFGRIDPPMSDLLRLRQGDVDLPLDGGSDTLRASTTWRIDDDGRLSLVHGDSFIQWVEWPADGGRVKSESIQPFGSATTRPESPHYTDQMQLYVDHKLKPVRFWEEDVRAHATSTRRVSNAR
ncbi:penicillin amidase family protein [Erythrobacter sp. NAP1]|uniref:acylase n=1 Tax=Erythrobacter sp. NAP1 TaxID=237727 RepID=UPI0000686DD4|nr:penicillin acylase family protein [Erythrobacter sp. NAP1]EAQ29218.1 penicillin amidase family protein [Erythrobacter sp. NAP1]